MMVCLESCFLGLRARHLLILLHCRVFEIRRIFRAVLNKYKYANKRRCTPLKDAVSLLVYVKTDLN